MNARLTDPDTSACAGASVDSHALERHVYEAICSFPQGCTADDLEAVLPYRWNTLTPRFKPLLVKGLIFDTGLRHIGRAGRPQRVVKAHPQQPKHW